MTSITEQFQRIKRVVPEYVTIVLASKTRTVDEVREAIRAGVTDIGENYVQEAEEMYVALGDDAQRVRWHLIGHLQKNKINRALDIFDVIQTVDSVIKAQAIDRRAEKKQKIVSVFIEINIGSEWSKSGLKPKYRHIKELVEAIYQMQHLRLSGLMTMGARVGDPEDNRQEFKQTRVFFDQIRDLMLPRTNVKYLSMGMSNSYSVAIEEGSNMIRLGTIVFGSRCER